MDPYRILGIDSSASDDEVKRAYRKLAKQYHPDVNKEPGAEEKFKQIQNAYDTIMKMRKEGTSYNQYNNYSQQTNYSSEYQAVYNYVNSGYFREAMAVLERITDKTGMWYYLHAICNSNLRNPIAAREDAEMAVRMEPNNAQYRTLLQRLQGMQNQYNFYSQPYVRVSNNNLCCQIARCYFTMQCLSLCCMGGPRF